MSPTLNAPLAKWDAHYGYRFLNIPPEEGNSDSLFVVALVSGGGTRASTLAFGALRQLAHQQSIRQSSYLSNCEQTAICPLDTLPFRLPVWSAGAQPLL